MITRILKDYKVASCEYEILSSNFLYDPKSKGIY